MSTLFDSAVSQLFHIPETLEKLVFSHSRSAQDGGHSRHAGSGAQEEEKSFGTAAVDIFEGPKAYVFYVDVPGLFKSDIQVTLEDEKVLVIKSNGKRKREEGEEEGCKFLRLERRASSKFMRRFKLPDDANPSAISAKCEHGVLTVTVEKVVPPELKPKTVEVTIA